MSDVEQMEVTVETKPTKKSKSKGKQKPNAQSHAELLKQAVVSKDSDKFFTVVRNFDYSSKRATIQDLDASFVLPTIKYINDLFRDDKLRERSSYLRDFRITIDLLESIIEIHSGYLSTLRNLDKQLGDLVEFAEARTANIEKLNQLEGRLQFVQEQMKTRVNPVKFGEQRALVNFEDDGKYMKKAIERSQS